MKTCVGGRVYHQVGGTHVNRNEQLLWFGQDASDKAIPRAWNEDYYQETLPRHTNFFNCKKVEVLPGDVQFINLGIKHTYDRFNTKHNRRVKAKPLIFRLTYSPFLIILSGDVELNPGPGLFACFQCDASIRDDQEVSYCEKCDQCCHKTCGIISDSWLFYCLKCSTSLVMDNPPLETNPPETEDVLPGQTSGEGCEDESQLQRCVFIILGGNSISTNTRPADVFNDLKNTVEELRACGVKRVLVSGIQQRSSFRDRMMTSLLFQKMRRFINEKLKRFLKRYYVDTGKELRFPRHFAKDGIHPGIKEGGMLKLKKIVLTAFSGTLLRSVVEHSGKFISLRSKLPAPDWPPSQIRSTAEVPQQHMPYNPSSNMPSTQATSMSSMNQVPPTSMGYNNQGYNNPTVYYGPNTTQSRPPLAPTQPVPMQPKKKTMLKIIDPNTGQEVVLGSSPADSGQRSTPVSTSNEEHSGKFISLRSKLPAPDWPPSQIRSTAEVPQQHMPYNPSSNMPSTQATSMSSMNQVPPTSMGYNNQGYNNPTVYYGPNTTQSRPPLAPTQPVPMQPKKKTMLKIIDPNTGQEVVLGSSPADSGQRSTPVSTSNEVPQQHMPYNPSSNMPSTQATSMSSMNQVPPTSMGYNNQGYNNPTVYYGPNTTQSRPPLAPTQPVPMQPKKKTMLKIIDPNTGQEVVLGSSPADSGQRSTPVSTSNEEHSGKFISLRSKLPAPDWPPSQIRSTAEVPQQHMPYNPSSNMPSTQATSMSSMNQVPPTSMGYNNQGYNNPTVYYGPNTTQSRPPLAPTQPVPMQPKKKTMLKIIDPNTGQEVVLGSSPADSGQRSTPVSTSNEEHSGKFISLRSKLPAPDWPPSQIRSTAEVPQQHMPYNPSSNMPSTQATSMSSMNQVPPYSMGYNNQGYNNPTVYYGPNTTQSRPPLAPTQPFPMQPKKKTMLKIIDPNTGQEVVLGSSPADSGQRSIPVSTSNEVPQQHMPYNPSSNMPSTQATSMSSMNQVPPTSMGYNNQGYNNPTVYYGPNTTQSRPPLAPTQPVPMQPRKKTMLKIIDPNTGQEVVLGSSPADSGQRSTPVSTSNEEHSGKFISLRSKLPAPDWPPSQIRSTAEVPQQHMPYNPSSNMPSTQATSMSSMNQVPPTSMGYNNQGYNNPTVYYGPNTTQSRPPLAPTQPVPMQPRKKTMLKIIDPNTGQEVVLGSSPADSGQRSTPVSTSNEVPQQHMPYNPSSNMPSTQATSMSSMNQVPPTSMGYNNQGYNNPTVYYGPNTTQSRPPLAPTQPVPMQPKKKTMLKIIDPNTGQEVVLGSSPADSGQRSTPVSTSNEVPQQHMPYNPSSNMPSTQATSMSSMNQVPPTSMGYNNQGYNNPTVYYGPNTTQSRPPLAPTQPVPMQPKKKTMLKIIDPNTGQEVVLGSSPADSGQRSTPVSTSNEI